MLMVCAFDAEKDAPFVLPPPLGVDRCSYVKTHCASLDCFAYVRAYYCWFGGMPWLGAAMLVAAVLAVFVLLYAVADGVLGTVLVDCGERLHMSKDLTGLTLLSLGNGAPDFFAAVACPSLSLMSTVAAAVLIVTLIVALVVCAYRRRPSQHAAIAAERGSVKIVFEKDAFWRNNVALVACAIFLALAVRQTATPTPNSGIWLPVLMLTTFVCYFAAGLFSFWRLQRRSKRLKEQQKEEAEDKANNQIGKEVMDCDAARCTLRQEVKKWWETRIRQASVHGAATAILAAIVRLPLLATLPPADVLRVNTHESQRLRLAASPLLGVNFVLWACDAWPRIFAATPHAFSVLIALQVALAVCCAVLYAATQPSRLIVRHAAMHTAALAWTFGLCVVWLWAGTEILMQLLDACHRIAHLRNTLALNVILAVGNCVGDALSNVALARRGEIDIVVTTVFASLVQNVLLTLPVALLRVNAAAATTKTSFDLTPAVSRFAAFSVAVFALCIAMHIIGVGFVFGRRVPRAYCAVGFVTFALYSAAFLLAACGFWF